MKNKPFEELLQLANDGNEEAMFYVAQHYGRNAESYTEYEKAAYWYEKLADKGQYQGMQGSMATNAVCGSICMAVTDFDAAKICWDRVKKSAYQLLEFCSPYEADEEVTALRDSAKNSIEKANYNLGLIYMDERKWDDVLKCVEYANNVPAKVLRGLAKFEKLNVDDAFTDLALALNSEFENMDKNLVEESLYSFATRALASYYSEGFGGISMNQNSAAEILSNTAKHMKDNIYRNLVIEDLKKIEDRIKSGYPGVSNGSNNSNTSSTGCYVATAVYGSYDCPEVWTLRRYRDYELANTWYGRSFIRTYYAVSPAIVKWFGKTKWFNHFWKKKLDTMVERLQKKGFDSSPYKDKTF